MDNLSIQSDKNLKVEAAEGSSEMSQHEPQKGHVGFASSREPSSHSSDSDPYQLRRFIRPHRVYHEAALREINAGEKVGHWSWYLFPVPPRVEDGVEKGSERAKQFALRDPLQDDSSGLEAAQAYLGFEADGVNLRGNYLAMMTAIRAQLMAGIHEATLLGDDVPKVWCSLRLFQEASADGIDPEVQEVCSSLLATLAEDRPLPRRGTAARRNRSL